MATSSLFLVGSLVSFLRGGSQTKEETSFEEIKRQLVALALGRSTTMPFLDELKNAIDNYAVDYVTLEIVNEGTAVRGAVDPTPDTVERATKRRVKVNLRNRGMFRLSSISLRLSGNLGGQVCWAADDGFPPTVVVWTDRLDSVPFYGETRRGEPFIREEALAPGMQWFFYRAPLEVQPPGTILVAVSMSGYHASW